MANDHLDSILRSFAPEFAKAFEPFARRCYDAGHSAGYAKGVEDVSADFTEILTAKASERLTAAKAEAPNAVVAVTKPAIDDRPQSDYPSYGYGVVTTAVRKIMGRVNGSGIEAREIVARLMNGFQLDVSIMTVRDTLARLRGRGEVYCVKRSWFATDKLVRELPLEENGPPEGKPKDGPDTAHAAQ